MDFFIKRSQQIKRWWNEPPSANDRFKSSVLSGFAGFWIGALGRLIFGPSSSSLAELFYYGLGGVFVGIVLGAMFPKVMRIIAFPFAFFGVGGGT